MRLLTGIFAAMTTAVLLAPGALAQETGPPSETAITTADCKSAWDDSDASASCTTTVIEAEPHVPGGAVVNNCAVKANCASTESGPHDTFSDYHGGPDGVESLLNCSGTLKTACGT